MVHVRSQRLRPAFLGKPNCCSRPPFPCVVFLLRDTLPPSGLRSLQICIGQCIRLEKASPFSIMAITARELSAFASRGVLTLLILSSGFLTGSLFSTSNCFSAKGRAHDHDPRITSIVSSAASLSDKVAVPFGSNNSLLLSTSPDKAHG